MDGQRFDALARVFAANGSRRTLLKRAAIAGGLTGALGMAHPAGAARRGSPGGNTAICNPNGAGGYNRITVSTVLLNGYLNNGAIISDCCSHEECGESNACMNAYCNFQAGACAVDYYDGSPCSRGGCSDGFCSGGACYDPAPRSCSGDGFCNQCSYDSCLDRCDCYVQPCYVDDYQCMMAWCDPDLASCMTEPINEGSPCNTFGVDGTCVLGYCTAA